MHYHNYLVVSQLLKEKKWVWNQSPNMVNLCVWKYPTCLFLLFIFTLTLYICFTHKIKHPPFKLWESRAAKVICLYFFFQNWWKSKSHGPSSTMGMLWGRLHDAWGKKYFFFFSHSVKLIRWFFFFFNLVKQNKTKSKQTKTKKPQKLRYYCQQDTKILRGACRSMRLWWWPITYSVRILRFIISFIPFNLLCWPLPSCPHTTFCSLNLAQ